MESFRYYYYTIDSIGFAQVGSEDFKEKENFELDWLQKYLLDKLGEPPEDTRYVRQRNEHDFGVYYTLALRYDGIKYDQDKGYCTRVERYGNRLYNIDIEPLEEQIAIAYNASKIALEDESIRSMEMENTKPLSLREVAKRNGHTSIEDFLEVAASDSVVPSLCPLGCQTEPDGKCEHGFESVLLAYGII